MFLYTATIGYELSTISYPMAELKTKMNKRKSVKKFLNSVENERRREDALQMLAIMEKVTGEKAVMWGDAIVGFGTYDYKRTNDVLTWFPVGFSPRKTALVLYSTPYFPEYKELLKKLGPVKHSVACIYIKNLEDVHMPTLKTLIRKSMQSAKKIKT